MRPRIASMSVCLLVAACGSGSTVGPEDAGVPGSTGAYVPTYSFDELRSGSLDPIIHCAGPLFDPEEFDGYDAAFPTTRPAMVRFNVSLAADRFTIDEKVATVEELLNERYAAELPLLSITYTVKSPSGVGAALDEDVVEGTYDADIRKLARGVATFHRPTFVRIASEFNGVWNNYRQAYYADSYRRIVDLFREEGADSTIFMWNYYPGEADFPYEDWYPGDDYVDWWSLDVFSPQFRSAAARQHMLDFLDDARKRGKAVIIPESAPNGRDMESAGTWDGWFQPYFALVKDPAWTIRGFCYSNRDFAKNDVTLTDWGNMRIDQSEALRPLYQAELDDAAYYHLPGG